MTVVAITVASAALALFLALAITVQLAVQAADLRDCAEVCRIELIEETDR
jgi:hypothetical protein